MNNFNNLNFRLKLVHVKCHCEIFETHFPLYLQGTLEERGILRWRQKDESWTASGDNVNSVYDLPCIQKYLNKLTITQYLPFCPNFQPCCGKGTGEKDEPPVEAVSVYEKKVEDTHM